MASLNDVRLAKELKQLKSKFTLSASNGLQQNGQNPLILWEGNTAKKNPSCKDNYFQRLLDNSTPDIYFPTEYLSADFLKHLEIDTFATYVAENNLEEWLNMLVKHVHNHVFTNDGDYNPTFKAFLLDMFNESSEFRKLNDEQKASLFELIRKDVMLSVLSGCVISGVNAKLVTIANDPVLFKQLNNATMPLTALINSKWTTNDNAVEDAKNLPPVFGEKEKALRKQITQIISIVDEALVLLESKKIDDEEFQKSKAALENQRDTFKQKLESKESLYTPIARSSLAAEVANTRALISICHNFVVDKEKEQLSTIKTKLNTLLNNILKIFKKEETHEARANTLFFKSNTLKKVEEVDNKLESEAVQVSEQLESVFKTFSK